MNYLLVLWTDVWWFRHGKWCVYNLVMTRVNPYALLIRTILLRFMPHATINSPHTSTYYTLSHLILLIWDIFCNIIFTKIFNAFQRARLVFIITFVVVDILLTGWWRDKSNNELVTWDLLVTYFLYNVLMLHMITIVMHTSISPRQKRTVNFTRIVNRIVFQWIRSSSFFPLNVTCYVNVDLIDD